MVTHKVDNSITLKVHLRTLKLSKALISHLGLNAVIPKRNNPLIKHTMNCK